MDGFALLGSHLGDPERKILTSAKIRRLTAQAALLHPEDPERSLQEEDLRNLGFGGEEAGQILQLLSEEAQLQAYLREGRRHHCHLLTRGEEPYPPLLRRRLGGESPCCLFYKGNPEILKSPGISLVGSRDLGLKNREFAREAGLQAARHGLTLISGNARGSDRTAQDACLEAGGRVISIVADDLLTKREDSNILYVSQEDFDAPFSAQRALSRNRVIHAMGLITLVSQVSLETGGTWSGTTQNLKQGWSVVACFRDGSRASLELQNRGAYLIGLSDLSHLTEIRDPQMNFFEDEKR